MDGRGIIDSVLSAVHPRLAGWVRDLGLDARPGLAGFFTEAEVSTGAAAMELFVELGGMSEEEFPGFASDLDVLIDFAKLQAEQRRRGFASIPEFSFRFERKIREGAERRAAEQARWERLEVQRQRASVPPLAPRPRLGFRQRRLRGLAQTAEGREEAEASRRRKWVNKLHQVLVELEAPILAVIAASSRPQELLESHVSGKRAATLAARLRAWARYRLWLRQAHGVGHPQSAHQVLDYLLDRRAEPCTRGTLSAIYSMIKFADQALGVPLESRWSLDPTVMAMVRGIIAHTPASVSRRSQGPANAPMTGVLMKLETMICDERHPIQQRLLGWWMLVSSWTASRFDDHRGLSPQDAELADGHFDALFKRSKTTGADKPVQFRRAVVAKDAWLVEPTWLECGWNLWMTEAPRTRDYFLTQWAAAGTVHYREMGYSEYAGRMRGILSELMDSNGVALGSDWATYLRPHSWRCFLPSAAIALGAPSDSLKWLSAWRAQSSESYVRTSRTRTMHTQTTIAKLLRFHVGAADPVGEAHALKELREHLRERGCEEGEMDRIVDALQVYGGKPAAPAMWDAVAGPTDSGIEGVAAGQPSSSSSTRGAVSRDVKEDSDDDSEDGAAVEGYVVAISRKGTRCLHKVGLCYRRPKKHYQHYQAFGATAPPVEEYDMYCKDCWRQVPREGVTSAAGMGSDTGSSRRTSSSPTSSSEASEA